MNECERTRGDGSHCSNRAQYRISLNGSMTKHYVCNVHVNQILRFLVNFDSPRLFEISTRA